MPGTIDTSRMSVEQMRAISAKRSDKDTAKSKGANQGWARPASQLEFSLMQGVPAEALLDPESSGFPEELHSALTGTVRHVNR